MNNIFNNLTTSLSEEFKKFELDEAIQLSMSKIAGYDLQINNLVKYNKSDFFDELQEKIIEKINSSNIFLPCLLYTSPSPRDMRRSRMPSSA